MDSLLAQLKQRQEALVQRSVGVVNATRDRGLSTLGVLRDGAIDWRSTLEAHRKELETKSPRWLTLRLRVVNRLDGLLDRFGERVRHEIERLSQLELAPGAPAPAEAPETPAPAKAKPTTNASPKKKPKAARALVAKPEKKTKAAKETSKAPSRRLLMPIRDYDALNAKQILSEIGSLTPAQCRTVLAHEESNKKRKTIVKALSAQIAG